MSERHQINPVDRLRRLLKRAAVVLGGGVLLTAAPTLAQDSQAPIELQETNLFGMGARAMGMGQAYEAVSEDVTALRFNPAGLAQIRRIELSAGVAVDDFTRATSHLARRSVNDTWTRLDHLAIAYPVPTYRGSLVLGLGFRREASLNDRFFRDGFLAPLTETRPGFREGVFELEDFQREGSINAWTAGAAIDLSPSISVGATVSYLSGTSEEQSTLAQYRAYEDDDVIVLDVLDPDNPAGSDARFTEAYFESRVTRASDLSGYTGSLGLLAYLDPGVRLGVTLDLPLVLRYEGVARTRLEDFEKIDEVDVFFQDDITMPLSVRGGLSWGNNGLLLAGSLRWTDYAQIDFEGDILAPPTGPSLLRESAYRSVVAFRLGAEYQVPGSPLRVRAGFFTEPVPYDLMTADIDFLFVPDDGNAATTDDVSIVNRDTPVADITGDRSYITLGGGFLVEDALTVDVAYLRGTWERRTPLDYENRTTFFDTTPTVEEVTENRVFVSTTFHFQ